MVRRIFFERYYRFVNDEYYSTMYQYNFNDKANAFQEQ